MAIFTIPYPMLKDKSDQEEVRKAFVDFANAIGSSALPIGFVYTQYPGQSDPATAFGGTWLNITSLYAGNFFRAEGRSASSFNSGTQADQMQGHYHSSYVFFGGGGAGLINVASGPNYKTDGTAGAMVTDGTNGTPRVGSETRPTNQTIRIWKRSA